MDANRRRFVTVSGALLLVMIGFVGRLGDLTENIPLFLAIFGAAFVIYATNVFAFSRIHAPYRQSLVLIFIVALGCRVVLIAVAPSLSNDVYRYLWEGRVIAAGHNPFALPPEAPELEALRDANYNAINHKNLTTIYPPAAQGVFVVAAAIAPTVTMQKLVLILFDLGTMVLIVLLLRRRGRNPNLCAVYGWSPLVIVEFAHSGHVDAVGIFFLVLAIHLFERGRAAGGMVAMGLSFLGKLLPLMLAPYFLRRRLLVWLPVAVAVALTGYLPFAGAGDGLWSSLGVYGRHWQFNSLVYRALESVWTNPDGIRLLLAGSVAAYAVYQALREPDITRFAFRVIACALLLSPTVYPWYIIWIVPLLCFHTSRAWLYFSGAVAVSYAVWPTYRATGVWRLGGSLLAMEYAPFYLLLAFEAVVGRRKGRA